MRVDDTGGQAPTFLVRFHGVRGSHPVTGPAIQHHGGNTSCIEVRCAGRLLVLDLGTGAIPLGRRLLAEAEGHGVEAAIFLSHVHHDHTMGFPFFGPVYDGKSRLWLHGPGSGKRSFQGVFEGAFENPFFPVPAQAMPSDRRFATLGDGDSVSWPRDGEPVVVPRGGKRRRPAGGKTPGEAPVAAPGEDGLVVRAFRNARHPNGGVLNYRVEAGGRSLVLATDVEGTEGESGDLVEFARGTDLLIHDAQYTDEEYEQAKQGWGHSTWRMSADVAWRAGAQRLVLYHHDPEHDDQAVEEIERRTREKFPRCVAACEGLEIRV